MDNPALAFLPKGYLLTVLIEAPILLFGLSKVHPFRRRLFAGLWLTACSYPVVILVLPVLIPNHTAYLCVAETFAPLSECFLFLWLFRPPRPWTRDIATIVLANLASFLTGEFLFN